MCANRALEVNGIDLNVLDHPAGTESSVDRLKPVLMLHETGESARSWSRAVAAIGGRIRAVAYDRRGWGESGAPDHYTRTTVAEQARDALSLLDRLEIEDAVFCGCGIGGLAALDAAVREPERVAAVVAVEPPLTYLLPDVTEGMSADVEALTAAAENGGIRAAAKLYSSGELTSLGPGAERAAVRCELEAPAVERPLSLFAEIAAVPAWSVTPRHLADIASPVSLVTGSDSPAITSRAADAAVDRAGRMRRIELSGDPLRDPALAELLLDLASA